MTHPYAHALMEAARSGGTVSITDPLGQLPMPALDRTVSPAMRQVPGELDALWAAVDRCEKMFGMLESRLAPFCLNTVKAGANPEAQREPLCNAAARIREVRDAAEALHERMQVLNSCLEV